MSWLDKSCLQLVVKRKDKPETLTFQVRLSSYFLSNFGDLASSESIYKCMLLSGTD